MLTESERPLTRNPCTNRASRRFKAEEGNLVSRGRKVSSSRPRVTRLHPLNWHRDTGWNMLSHSWKEFLPVEACTCLNKVGFLEFTIDNCLLHFANRFISFDIPFVLTFQRSFRSMLFNSINTPVIGKWYLIISNTFVWLLRIDMIQNRLWWAAFKITKSMMFRKLRNNWKFFYFEYSVTIKLNIDRNNQSRKMINNRWREVWRES